MASKAAKVGIVAVVVAAIGGVIYYLVSSSKKAGKPPAGQQGGGNVGGQVQGYVNAGVAIGNALQKWFGGSSNPPPQGDGNMGTNNGQQNYGNEFGGGGAGDQGPPSPQNTPEYGSGGDGDVGPPAQGNY